MKPRALLATIILAVLIAIPTMASAAALHYFDCDDCHRDGATWNTVDAQGVCISCHNAAGNPAYVFPRTQPDTGATTGAIPPGFSTGDASNAFGNGKVPMSQNSHNWGASDRNPAAGAAPASSLMYNARRGASRGFVSCYKCHDPHALYDADYATGNEKMLRTANLPDGDGTSKNSEQNVEAMCVECHLDWASMGAIDRGLKSHPMINDYNAFVAAQTLGQERYKSFVPNGDMKLLGAGATKVGCTTCHGLHGADSNATTPTNIASALTGDGMLLRGDGVASDPTGNLLCTSCHMYMGHPSTSGGTSVGCLVCHSGHSYNDGTPNVFVLRSEVIVPADSTLPTKGTTVGPLRYTTIPSTPAEIATVYAGAGGNDGYCTGCHGQITATGVGMPSEFQLHTGTEDCSACHAHFDPANPLEQSWVGKGCNGCHGYPPRTITAGGPDGYAVDGLKDYSTSGLYKIETNTPHATHALSGSNPVATSISCATCHTSYPANHNTGTFQNVLETADTKSALVTANGILSPLYTKTGAGSCSAVYCHSNGGTYTGLPKVLANFTTTTVSWDNANGTITGCAACHDDNTSGIGGAGPKNNSPAHAKHVARYDAVDVAGSSCNLCHDQTTDGSTITGLASHVDGTVQFVTDATFVIDTVSGATLGGSAGSAASCAVYCHSDGNGVFSNPAWDGSANCGSCHSTDPTTIDLAQGGGAHFLHLSDPNGPGAIIAGDCSVCHTHDGSFAPNNGHIDKSKLVKANACDACHGKPAVGGWTAAGTVDESPTWTVPATVRCDTCHSGTVAVINAVPAPLVAEAAYANGHGKVGVAQTCTACHEANTVAGHLAGATVERLRATLPVYAATDDRNFCNVCHTTVGSVNNHNVNDGTVCQTCHAQHGEANGNDAMIKSTIATHAVTGFTAQGVRSSYVKADFTGVCQACHNTTTTKYFSPNKYEDLTHNPGQACSDCHNHASAPAFTGVGDSCDSCHGYPPNTAAHAVHAPDSFSADTLGKVYRDLTNGFADVTACVYCHTGTDLYTYQPAADRTSGTAGRTNHGAGEVTQDATLGTTVGYTGTNCTTACHATTVGQAALWTDPSLACGACHGDVKGAATEIASGSHSKHLAVTIAPLDCTTCHQAAIPTDTAHISGLDATGLAGTTEGATLTLRATPVADNAEVLAPTFVDGTNTCNNAACHNPSGTTYSAVWGTANAVGCAFCHSATDPGTNKHNVHVTSTVAGGITCTSCHVDNGLNNAHRTGTVNVAGSVSLYATPNCTNSCHAPATVSWTAGTLTCTDCHTGTYVGGDPDGVGPINNLPTSGLHNVTPTISGQTHDQSVTGGCVACHNTLAAKATHIDGTFTGDTIANLGLQYYTQSAANTGTCLTTCHTTLSGDWAHKWDSTANYYTTATTSCAGCHGDWNQTWNSGVIHRTAAGVESMHGTGTTYQCKDCHALEATSNSYTFAFGSNDWGGTSKHGNGTIEVNSNTATYDPATGICATCHTATGIDGQHNFLDTGWTIAAIAGDSINATCGSCHTGGKSTTGSSGAHDTHGASLADETTCYACHGNNAGAGYAVYTGSHNNGSVNFAAVDYSTATRNDVTGTCNTTACHNQGASGTDESTAWNSAALSCDDCHYYAVGTTPTATGNTAATTSLSADHGNHFGTGGTFACATCHGTDPVYDTHMTQLTGATLAAKATPVQDNATVTVTTWVDGTNTCNNAACHNPSGGTYAAVWQTSTVSCTLCHGDMTTKPTSGSHGQHLNAATTFGINTIACASCHGTLPVSNSHLNSTVNFAAGMGYTTGAETVGGSVGTCTTTTCHNNGTAAATAVPTPTWGVASANCSICHVATPTSGEHTAHLGSTNYVTSSCDSCHTAETATTHINNVRNFGVPISAYTAATGTCTNTCHTVVDGRDWTAGAALDCADCHNAGATKSLYVAAGSSNWPINSNKHAEHTGSNSLPQTGANDCFACHNTTVNSSGAIIAAGTHLDTVKGNISFNSTYNYESGFATRGATTGTTTTCSAVICHNGVTTPTWAAASTISCGKCHNTGGTGPLPSGSTLGSHAKHANNDGDFADCAKCHVGAGSTYSPVGGDPNHQNLVVNVVPTTGTYSDAVAGVATNSGAGVNYGGDFIDNGTCANSCHGVTSPTWGNVGSVTCTSCHNNGTDNGLLANAVPLATAAVHTTHINANNAYVASDCDACHGATAIVGTHTGHIDSSPTYAGKLSAYVADGTCTNNCHTVVSGRDWSPAGTLACDDCHGATGKDLYRSRVSGSHSSHYSSVPVAYGSGTYTTNNSSGTTYNYGCGLCHNGTHLNVSTGGELRTGINYSGGAAGTCSSNSCHQDGRSGAPATVPTWGTAFTGDTCNKCHGNSPTTNAHQVHAVGIHATDIYTGTTGLLAAGATAPTGHGDGNSTTISCNICHNSTVTTTRNRLGSECVSCHTGDLATTDMVVSNTANHVNGTTTFVNVVFAPTAVKSKAQLRDNLTDAGLATVWTRTNGYKAATSYDVAPTTLAATATFASASSTCSAVACHNGIAVTWQPPQNNCMTCHTSLPK